MNWRAVVSSQVLQEFAAAAKRKLLLPGSDIQKILANYERLGFTPITNALVRRAVGTSEESKISFWDALVVEAASAAGCTILYTEDLNHGQIIRGVKIVNPFVG